MWAFAATIFFIQSESIRTLFVAIAITSGGVQGSPRWTWVTLTSTTGHIEPLFCRTLLRNTLTSTCCSVQSKVRRTIFVITIALTSVEIKLVT